MPPHQGESDHTHYHCVQVSYPCMSLSPLATTVSRCGPLIDLCRGPHVRHTGKIKSATITKVPYLFNSRQHTLWNLYSTMIINQWFGDSFSCHNLNFVGPISIIFWFSESLERYLSNGVIKNHIWEIKVFANLAVPWIIAHGPRPKNDKLRPRQHFGFKHTIWKVSF